MRYNLPESIPKGRRETIESILSAVISNNSGKDSPVVCETKPSKKFFMGTLSPIPTKEELITFANKVLPPTIGLEFLVKTDYSKDAKISITPSGSFYYRAFPGYEGQLEFSKKATSEGAKSAPLREEFKKAEIEVEPITIRISDAISKCEAQGEVFESLKRECEMIWDGAKKDRRFYLKKKKSRSKWPRVPLDALDSKGGYEEFTTKNLGSPPPLPMGHGH
mgnify:CR=1 FL=1